LPKTDDQSILYDICFLLVFISGPLIVLRPGKKLRRLKAKPCRQYGGFRRLVRAIKENLHSFIKFTELHSRSRQRSSG